MSIRLLGWFLAGAILTKLFLATPVGAQSIVLVFGSASGNPQVIQTDGSNAMKVAIQ